MTIARVTVSHDQIRWYLDLAINAFDTLDQAAAVKLNLSMLNALKRHLTEIERLGDIRLDKAIEDQSDAA